MNQRLINVDIVLANLLQMRNTGSDCQDFVVDSYGCSLSLAEAIGILQEKKARGMKYILTKPFKIPAAVS